MHNSNNIQRRNYNNMGNGFQRRRYSKFGGKNKIPFPIRLLLDSKKVGGLIGKGGQSIQRIRSTSGAKILIDKQTKSSGLYRICSLEGNYNQILKGIELICDKMAEESSRIPAYNITILVEEKNCGCLIGKQGRAIADIRHKTGAEVHIASTILRNSSEKTVDINGNRESVHKAVGFVIKKLIDNPTRIETRRQYDPNNDNQQQIIYANNNNSNNNTNNNSNDNSYSNTSGNNNSNNNTNNTDTLMSNSNPMLMGSVINNNPLINNNQFNVPYGQRFNTNNNNNNNNNNNFNAFNNSMSMLSGPYVYNTNPSIMNNSQRIFTPVHPFMLPNNNNNIGNSVFNNNNGYFGGINTLNTNNITGTNTTINNNTTANNDDTISINSGWSSKDVQSIASWNHHLETMSNGSVLNDKKPQLALNNSNTSMNANKILPKKSLSMSNTFTGIYKLFIKLYYDMIY